MTETGSTSLLIGSIVLSTLVQQWRIERTRKWSEQDADRKLAEAAASLVKKSDEDRDALARKADDDRNELSRLVLRATQDLAAELKSRSAASHAETVKQLAVVGEAAQSAYHEANQSNRKIEDLHKQGVAASKLVVETAAALKRKTDVEVKALLENVQKVGESASKAYHEANSVNTKIQDLQQQRIDMAATSERLVTDAIQRAGKDNHSGLLEMLTGLSTVSEYIHTAIHGIRNEMAAMAAKEEEVRSQEPRKPE